MQITLKEKIVTDKVIDVTFPIYRKHVISLDDDNTTTIYMRVDPPSFQRMREVSIEWNTRGNSNNASLTIDDNYHFDGSAEDYLLGRGVHACTETEFNEAIAWVQTLVATARYCI